MVLMAEDSSGSLSAPLGVLGGDQGADQVVARRGAAFGDQVADIAADPAAGLQRRGPGLLRALGRHQRGRALEGRAELLAVVGRDADDLAGDDDRHMEGEVGDQVELALGRGGVEQLVDHRLDARPGAPRCCASRRPRPPGRECGCGPARPSG